MATEKEGTRSRMVEFDLFDDGPGTANDSGPLDNSTATSAPEMAVDFRPSAMAQDCEPPKETFFIRLRCDLQAHDVVSLIHYITVFGSGDARGFALDGGWSIRLTKLTDLQLVAAQYPDLIEDHSTS